MARILVVDTLEEITSLFAEELNRGGHETGVAHNGVEAVIKAIDGNWDAVLMGVCMPRLNGTNALMIMKKIKPHLPVVMFTSLVIDYGELVIKCRGADACLRLPVRMDTILSLANQARAAGCRQWKKNEALSDEMDRMLPQNTGVIQEIGKS